MSEGWKFDGLLEVEDNLNVVVHQLSTEKVEACWTYDECHKVALTMNESWGKFCDVAHPDRTTEELEAKH